MHAHIIATLDPQNSCPIVVIMIMNLANGINRVELKVLLFGGAIELDVLGNEFIVHLVRWNIYT